MSLLVEGGALDLWRKAQTGLKRALPGIWPTRQRTLFCIIGNLRGGVLPFESFLKNFGDDCDLCLCVGNSYQDSPWRQRANYIWEIDETDPQVWERIYDGISSAWRHHAHVENLWGPYQGLKGSGMIICAFRQRLHEKLSELPVVYERYVLTRADQYYVSNELPRVKPGRIYIPKGEEYGGVTDRFSVADRETFLRSLQIIPYIIQNPYLFNNVEKYLKAFYKSSGLRIVKSRRTMYTVGRIDEQTRWRAVSDIEAPHGGREYFLKYPSEYALIEKSFVFRSSGAKGAELKKTSIARL